MTPREIIHKVRMAPDVNDTNEAKYSDYQMLDALNTVLNLVYNELGTFSNELLTKTEVLELRNGTAELPEDFLQAVEVYHGNRVYMPEVKGRAVSPYTYTIYGNTIQADTDKLTLDYKPSFEEITMDGIDDDLPLPKYFKELLKRCVIKALSGNLETDEGLEVLRVDVKRITAGRGYTALEMKNVWSERL